MTIWTRELLDSSKTRHESIAHAIGLAIERGTLVSGERLPSQRWIASRLSVSLGTVTRALNEARARGWVVGEVGRGTFVRSLPIASLEFGKLRPLSPSAISMEDNVPVVLSDQEDEILRAAFRHLQRRADLGRQLASDWHLVSPRHLTTGRQWFARLGLDVDPKRLHVCTSTQAALSAALLAFARQGEPLVVPEMTHPGILSLCGKMRIPVLGVEVDDEGPIVGEWLRIAAETGARLLYLEPTLASPTTLTVTRERRGRLAKAAKENDLMILEDESSGFLLDPQTDPIVPLAALAPDNVILIGDTTKVLSLSARVTFVATPARVSDSYSSSVSASMWMPVPLLAEIVGRWIRTGEVETIARARREVLRWRNMSARSALPRKLHGHPSAHHVWLPIDDDQRSDELAGKCLRNGVLVNSSEWFAVNRNHCVQGLRLCLGAAPDRETFLEGLRRVADVVA